MGMGDPEDLTGAVILLCSDAGKFMTGVDIRIEGKWDDMNRSETLPLTTLKEGTRFSKAC